MIVDGLKRIRLKSRVGVEKEQKLSLGIQCTGVSGDTDVRILQGEMPDFVIKMLFDYFFRLVGAAIGDNDNFIILEILPFHAF